MTINVQSTYNRYYQKGQVGQVAKTNEVYNFEQATVNVSATADALPGQAVYIQRTAGVNQGNWIVASSVVEAQTVATHILGFETNDVVKSVDGGSVTYPAGTKCVKAMPYGTIYVTAGAAIVRGQAVYFDNSDLTAAKWLPVDADPATQPAASFIALENAADGETFGIRITRTGLGAI